MQTVPSDATGPSEEAEAAAAARRAKGKAALDALAVGAGTTAATQQVPPTGPQPNNTNTTAAGVDLNWRKELKLIVLKEKIELKNTDSNKNVLD